jgi:hypothetical protein
MVAAYSVWVHILKLNKGLNVYRILTAVIYLLNSREEVDLMNAQDEIHQIPTNYNAAIYVF